MHHLSLFAPVLAFTLFSIASPVPEPLLGLGGIVGTVGGAVGSVPALITASCNLQYTTCTASVSGEIENLLKDGKNFTGQAKVNGWINNGTAYGNATLAGAAPAPFTISCNATANVCTGNASASVTKMFSNGKQIQEWGWLSPAGHCNNGTCTGSITMAGDPYYLKA